MLFACLLATGTLFAQVRIKGRILNDKNEPLVGATIAEDGNQRNVLATDANGNYQMTVKNANSTIIVTAVGFITYTFKANDKRTTFVLSADTKGLDDVVVVGYGRQKRLTNTGAVSSIQAAEVKDVPTSSLQNTLVGRLARFLFTTTQWPTGFRCGRFLYPWRKFSKRSQ